MGHSGQGQERGQVLRRAATLDADLAALPAVLLAFPAGVERQLVSELTAACGRSAGYVAAELDRALDAAEAAGSPAPLEALHERLFAPHGDRVLTDLADTTSRELLSRTPLPGADRMRLYAVLDAIADDTGSDGYRGGGPDRPQLDAEERWPTAAGGRPPAPGTGAAPSPASGPPSPPPTPGTAAGGPWGGSPEVPPPVWARAAATPAAPLPPRSRPSVRPVLAVLTAAVVWVASTPTLFAGDDTERREPGVTAAPSASPAAKPAAELYAALTPVAAHTAGLRDALQEASDAPGQAAAAGDLAALRDQAVDLERSAQALRARAGGAPDGPDRRTQQAWHIAHLAATAGHATVATYQLHVTLQARGEDATLTAGTLAQLEVELSDLVALVEGARFAVELGNVELVTSGALEDGYFGTVGAVADVIDELSARTPAVLVDVDLVELRMWVSQGGDLVPAAAAEAMAGAAAQAGPLYEPAVRPGTPSGAPSDAPTGAAPASP